MACEAMSVPHQPPRHPPPRVPYRPHDPPQTPAVPRMALTPRTRTTCTATTRSAPRTIISWDRASNNNSSRRQLIFPAISTRATYYRKTVMCTPASTAMRPRAVAAVAVATTLSPSQRRWAISI